MPAEGLGNKVLSNQFLRFAVSAGAGFLVDICSYYLFYHNLFRAESYRVINYSVSNYILSLGVSFFFRYKWPIWSSRTK